MGRPPALGGLLLLLGLHGTCGGFKHENCTDYKLQFERVFSVPGDTAMLNSTLVSPDVFDFTTVPFSVTWYDPKTGLEMSNQSGRVLVAGEMLWVLNLQLEDSGEYVTVLRTPSRCYRQATKLLVEPPPAAECGRPRKARQTLTNTVTDVLNCPLKDYVGQLDRYNVTSHLTWYRGCERIVDGKGRYTYLDKTKLKIDGVEPNNNSSYTCTLNFTLGGMNGSVSETIEAWVSEKYSLTPQIREPANQRLKAPMGSSYSQRCRVFVPCVGKPRVDVVWMDRHSSFILNTKPDHIYTSKQSFWRQELPRGVWLERVLMFSRLTEEDFYVNYTCLAQSSRGTVKGYFSLLPADPNIILPIGSALGGVTALFIVSIVLYYLLKVDIVLWFRRAFPVLYTNTDLDGKWYDAYVAYPQACAAGFSKEVEAFALHTLPQVLEEACGYKLFIAGRDCMPGTAIVDSVEENIQASRRLLLLYTASTFTSRRHTNNNNNNNISKSSDGDDDVYPDSRQQLECVTAMHRALLEGSLKVILVELEKISPAQLALFPESVRHLRKKQGAVCWWKNPSERRGWRTCTACTTEDQEEGGRDALCPSSGFWKELRYRMPVRPKRAMYPEKTALLNL
ncbi:interleukin-1 receptor type 1 [Cyclopterus lumpus]|uniref:Zmp:0000000936 n=2 Tax=Cyclopterus lumpus TaxID=8103 RepID=A0A8C3ANH7_CYCLU|nr:interleukin-1 receptor type 1 [Cyclopterus lumpus]XP_034418166.1 interleukin-1 receptor type 1 [Cyclopterus lumpus]